jgi:hypothetical protein
MSVIHHPSILRDVISGKNSEEIRAKVRSLDVKGRGLGKEIPEFISYLKRTSPYDINPKDKPKLNRLCYVEDSENRGRYFLHYNWIFQEGLGNMHLQ